MEVLKFNLSGKTAFFKKPDVNSYAYFTYNNIHKIALLGIIGATIGLGGWQEKEEPEFYKKLKHLKVSIVPKAKSGYFTKKMQYFNNSTGFASNEEGGNLQVREQWLEFPNWDIYIMQGTVESGIWVKIKDFLLNSKCVYIPYLGKNDHPATISNVQLFNSASIKQPQYIHSLFIIEDTKSIDDEYTENDALPYMFIEHAPSTLNEEKFFYMLSKFIFTNYIVQETIENVFSIENLNLFFY